MLFESAVKNFLFFFFGVHLWHLTTEPYYNEFEYCSIQLQPACVYLGERVFKFVQLVRTKTQPALARCIPPSVQE